MDSYQPTSGPEGSTPPQPEAQVFGHPSSHPAAGPAIVDDWLTAPAAPVIPSSPRARRIRWAIALGLVLSLVVVSAGAALMMIGAGASSLTVGHAPKTSVVYASLRTDPPGNQHQGLADFMSHFPGFKDRAAFDLKIRELINDEMKKVAPDISVGTDVAPWMGNEIAIAVTRFDPSKAMTQGLTSGIGMGPGLLPGVDPSADPLGRLATPPVQIMPADSGVDAVVIVNVKDAKAAEAWITQQRDKRAKFTSETYAGTTIWSASATGTASSGSYAFTGDTLLVGTTPAVKAALDAPTAGSLDGTENYKAALKAMSGDRIGVVYVDTKAYLAAMAAMGSTSDADSKAMLDYATKQTPAWMAASLRVDGGSLSVEMVQPKTAASIAISNSVSALAPLLPKTTVAMAEVDSVGKTVDQVLAMYGGAGAPASMQQAAAQVRSMLKPVDSFRWAGDTAVAVLKRGNTFDVGGVIQTPDAKAAEGAANSLFNAISAGVGAESSQVKYNGVDIDVLKLGQGTGMGLDQGIAIAHKDRLVIVGLGPDFVKAILDSKAGDSLADQALYKNALAAAGDQNSTQAYLDIPAVLDWYAASLPSEQRAAYTTDQLPYLQQLDAAAMTTISGDPTMSRIVVTVK